MGKTLTWRYDEIEQAKNVSDELLAAGVPAECLYIDEPKKSIKIIIAEDSKPGVLEILRTHGLTEAVR
jgi:hypothetical protein